MRKAGATGARVAGAAKTKTNAGTRARAASRAKKKRRKAKRRGRQGLLGRAWYRPAEVLVGGALVAVGTLAVLARLAGAVSPVALLAALTAAAVLSVVLVFLLEKLRRGSAGWRRHALNAFALSLIGLAGWYAPPTHALDALREVLAGERQTQVRVVRHQVYAAYRRMNLADQLKILERGRVYEPTVQEAAEAFGEDAEILMGVAATESSFYPRPSRDGGRGLFQITAVPAAAEAAARAKLGIARLDPVNQRHNAFVAAATLAQYREQMAGDLFLTLLAYNIGPHNGGLAFIMEKYGASNFAQAQPYLQELPRDYPVRVLAAALAYRVWRQRGELPRYEEDGRAAEIQALGIPGLDDSRPATFASWFKLTPDRASRTE
ncbi:MAG: transglycosylase SLT domain-containing protein [Deltaproteobacteria bacterium]